MISSGRRDEFGKAMSAAGSQSNSQRMIDIIGVMPEPAEMNRYLFAELRNCVKWPLGP